MNARDAWLIGEIETTIDGCARRLWEGFVGGTRCVTPQDIARAMDETLEQIDRNEHMHECPMTHVLVHKTWMLVSRALCALLAAPPSTWNDRAQLEQQKILVLETAISRFDALARASVGLKPN